MTPTTETPSTEDSNLVRHAREELRRAGMFDEDADYGPELAVSIVDVVALFASWGHSGGSAALAADALERLLRFKTLTPLTSDPDEWMNISDTAGAEVWQNRRQSSCFSTDGGRTWYDINDEPVVVNEPCPEPTDPLRRPVPVDDIG